jgi:hypothetical protein
VGRPGSVPTICASSPATGLIRVFGAERAVHRSIFRTASSVMRQKATGTPLGTTTAKHRALAISAAACAEGVLSHFETARPGDERPRRAIEAARAWVRGELKMSDARRAAFAAHAAARATDCPSACAAARAAGHAAATAHVASHARHASAYALKALAARRSQPAA